MGAHLRSRHEESLATEPVINRVLADLRDRDRVGYETYGGPLMADDGRDALWEAYEEALDLCVYLRLAIDQRQNDRD